VRNVTTIVGLRAYSAKSNILPEQTLGRGLRKMYPGGVEEQVSVVGTDAFMDFVESIQAEGVELEHKAMGEGTGPKAPLVVEVDHDNENKDITSGEVTHTTILDSARVADYRSVIAYFARTVMKELKLVSGYDVLYGKIKAFVHNDLTVRDKGDAEIRDTIKLRQTRPFEVKEQGYLMPKKSVFNRVIGDSYFELQFASFLEHCNDVTSYAKNYLAVHFKLDYVNADGDISNYYPDFMVKLEDGWIVIVETKGLEDLDVPFKMVRLSQWCEDMNRVQSDAVFDFVFVDQEGFEKYAPKSFASLLAGFDEYK